MVRFGRRPLSEHRRSTVRTALLVLLVVVVVVTGLPVMVGGMGMEPCPDCGPATLACSVSCATLPAAVLVAVATLFSFMVVAPRRRHGLEFAWSIDPPPRVA